ncbi:hypothetical protein HYPSUDRAFT_517945 [Hypholoma sublateritium FD-334 SS-4]|uniref:Uncharacterized protein n=1 Tax=Hypholoma sublateritium (strain FD-334 SS-4) TaxID=945553 RepID=A0A0D2PM73_HYPSF|nr:hypothetical protein HYPSUDRAFT_517945 [Hypholoma sublateritium FD-334 SS-4]
MMMSTGDFHLTLPKNSLVQQTSPTFASGNTEAPRKSRQNKQRCKKRQEEKAKHGFRPSAAAIRRYVVDSTKIHIPIDCATLLAARVGYRTRNTNISAAQAAYNEQALLSGHGFKFLDWNGVDPLLVIDNKDRIAIALVGPPKTEDFQTRTHSIHQALLAEGLLFKESNAHSCGENVVVNAGVTYGKGTREPVSLDTKKNGAVASRLLSNRDIQRLSWFASSSLALYAPKLYSHCRAKLNTLPVQFPRLAPFFPDSSKVFPATAFDLGPGTSAQKNRTALNHPYGWSATQAFGQFDPTKGGQLVFWEPRLIVQFPPGALVLHPAAMITVTTTPVNEGETRTSMTQYIPASLFQYVESGFRSAKELKVHNAVVHQGDSKSGADKWRMGLDLFTTLDELPK